MEVIRFGRNMGYVLLLLFLMNSTYLFLIENKPDLYPVSNNMLPYYRIPFILFSIGSAITLFLGKMDYDRN